MIDVDLVVVDIFPSPHPRLFLLSSNKVFLMCLDRQKPVWMLSVILGFGSNILILFVFFLSKKEKGERRRVLVLEF